MVDHRFEFVEHRLQVFWMVIDVRDDAVEPLLLDAVICGEPAP